MKYLSRIISLVTLLMLSGNLFAKEPGSSTAAFLKIPTSARAVGMGEAFVAVADDGYTLNWNPAGLGKLPQAELDFTHVSYLLETNYDYVSYFNPLGKYGGIAIGGILLNSNGIPKTTEDGSGNLASNNSSFDVSNSALMVGWGKSFGQNMSIGVNLKNISQKIDTNSSGGYAGDAGVLYSPKPFLQFGAAIQNLGPDIDGDKLPTIVRFGCVGKYKDSFLVPIEVDKPIDGDVEFGVGAEKWLGNVIALRVGYKSGVDIEDANGLRAGASFQFRGFRLDYAYANYGEFDAVHQFSFGMKFGKKN